uniref:7TM_GPCR_Srx domain-containing protein n=1 Tax=Steinernema glaseri TaxID=37863 RepID=A0A1I7ZK39_9BILA
MLSVPILIGSFILYWKKCITWEQGTTIAENIVEPSTVVVFELLHSSTFTGYDVFAICEYAGVFLNIAYHGCAFFDIRYKVVFTVRLVEHIEQEQSENRIEMKKPLPQESAK